MFSWLVMAAISIDNQNKVLKCKEMEENREE